MAHQCVEWDGWEERLIESILGPENQEEEWFQDSEVTMAGQELVPSPGISELSDGDDVGSGIVISTTSLTQRKLLPRSPLAKAKAKAQMLDTTVMDVEGGEGSPGSGLRRGYNLSRP
jgi:hypothetical protein